ncbi:MAG: hypothetical protein ACMXX8_03005, partial [Candidatus Woesearchaeota archaeon]
MSLNHIIKGSENPPIDIQFKNAIGGEYLELEDTTPPATTDNKLYSVNGELFYDGVHLTDGTSISKWIQDGNDLYPVNINSKVGINTDEPDENFELTINGKAKADMVNVEELEFEELAEAPATTNDKLYVV